MGPKIPNNPMLHPGFLPILTLTAEPKLPTAEVIAILLDANVTQLIVQSEDEASTKLIEDLLALREYMEFGVIVPSASEMHYIASSLGVHINGDLHSIHNLRAALTKNQLIVCSVKSFDEAQLAEANGADTIILGPVFGDEGIGVMELEDACQTLSVPVFASGGINAGNLLQITDAGAYGFTVPELEPTGEMFEHEITKLTELWTFSDDL